MRVLVLTHRLPYAPNRGDRIRSFHLIEQLGRTCEVDLLSLVHDDDEASRAATMRGLASPAVTIRPRPTRNLLAGLAALPTSRPLTHVLLDGPGLDAAVERLATERRPDVVLAYGSGMARLAFTPALSTLPLVLDMVDVDSAKWAALACTTSFPRSWIYAREARTLARFEAQASRRAFATLVTTEREREELLAIAPGARVDVVQNGVDAVGLRPVDRPGAAPIAIFSGVLNYEPNVEAAQWLVREVWPHVRATRSDARLQIVGARPTRSVWALASGGSGIEVIADVPDMRPHLWGAAVAVAPLHTARGVQNKVLEAVAAGLPAVVTPVVMTGVPVEVAPACVVAADARAFARAIVGLLNEPADDRRARVLGLDLAPLTWPRRLEAVSHIVAHAAQNSV